MAILFSIDTCLDSTPTVENIDNYIQYVLMQKRNKLDERIIINMLQVVEKILVSEESSLDLDPPLIVIGDIHGQFFDLVRIFQICGDVKDNKYLFLGDYVDRGYNSFGTFLLLLLYKIKYPENIFLIRGNHESSDLSRNYGFYDEVTSKYNESLFYYFVNIFNALPLAAVIGKRIFCVHGGLSPMIKTVSEIKSIKRPVEIPNAGPITDMLWADPSTLVEEFEHSVRGSSYLFGSKASDTFLKTNKLSMIVRAHQVVINGYALELRGKYGKVLTVFSASNYGTLRNKSAVMFVTDNCTCEFQTFRSIHRSEFHKLKKRDFNTWSFKDSTNDDPGTYCSNDCNIM